MKDLYLQALLHGEISNMSTKEANHEQKNRFELAIEAQIDGYIKEVPFEENPENKFVTPAMKIDRLRAELKEESQQFELSHYLDDAFQILEVEGRDYLSKEQYNAILEELARGLTLLDQAVLMPDATIDFKTLLSISDATEASIVSLAEKKAAETGPRSCLPLYILLSLLIPGNATYWYRAALGCHSNKNYGSAIRFYNTAFSLKPELVEAKIFLSDCYLEDNRITEALQSFQEAEKLNEITPLEAPWKSFMTQLSQKLHA